MSTKPGASRRPPRSMPSDRSPVPTLEMVSPRISTQPSEMRSGVTTSAFFNTMVFMWDLPASRSDKLDGEQCGAHAAGLVAERGVHQRGAGQGRGAACQTFQHRSGK